MNLRVLKFGKFDASARSVRRPAAGRAGAGWSASVLIIEMIYHLQLERRAADRRCGCSASRSTRTRAHRLGRSRSSIAGRRRRCVRVLPRRRFSSEWDDVAGRDRETRDRARESHERRPASTRRSNCTTCARASARPRSSAASSLQIPRGERLAHHRPERRRQVDAVQPDQRPLRSQQRRRSLLNGQRIDRPQAVRDQPPGPVAQLPDHQHLPPAVGVREPALRGAVVARLPYSFWQHLDDLHDAERARRRGAASGSA